MNLLSRNNLQEVHLGPVASSFRTSHRPLARRGADRGAGDRGRVQDAGEVDLSADPCAGEEDRDAEAGDHGADRERRPGACRRIRETC